MCCWCATERTIWVNSHRLAGRTPGVHLNDNGHSQTERLVQAFAQQPVSAIYSSPLERCLETAQPVAAALGLPVTTEAGVVEVDYGEWQGGDLRELAKSPDWQLVQHLPSSFRFPQGETLYEVQARAVKAIERIRAAHPNQVAVIFSHGDVIRTTLAHYLGAPIDLFQRVAVSTASISAIGFHGPHPAVLFTNYLADLPKFEFAQEEQEGDSATDAAGDAANDTATVAAPNEPTMTASATSAK